MSGTQQVLRPGRGRRSGARGRRRRGGATRSPRSPRPTTSTTLKAARLAHAGDRSPLALANREIGALPPAAKAEAGKRVGQARGRVSAALADRQAELEAERDARVLVEEARRRHAAGRPPPAGARHPLQTLPGADRRHVRRHGLGGRRGARGRGRVVQLRRAELRPRPPGPADAGHLLRRPAGGRAGPAHAHLAGADPDACSSGARRSTSSAPARCSAPTSSTPPTRRSSTRSRGWPSTRA